jgi:hypothetical protein
MLALLVIGVWISALPGFLSYRLQKQFQEVERKQFYDLLNKQRLEILNYERLLSGMANKGVRQ